MPHIARIPSPPVSVPFLVLRILPALFCRTGNPRLLRLLAQTAERDTKSYHGPLFGQTMHEIGRRVYLNPNLGRRVVLR